MSLIEWKDSFKSGFPPIDHEHRLLISLINELFAKISARCSRDEVNYYLGEIHAQIEAHFALEEKLMRDSNFADYATHKEDHDRLLETIRDIMEEVKNDPEYDCEIVLGGKMSAWFGVHFRTLDGNLHAMAQSPAAT